MPPWPSVPMTRYLPAMTSPGACDHVVTRYQASAVSYFAEVKRQP
jgi:hypothetical protein